MKFSSKVPSYKGKKVPLVDYIAKRFTYFSREIWLEKIKNNQITIEGRIAKADDFVEAGQIIVYDAGEIQEPEADLNYSVIYEDEYLLAVNKSGNLLVHRAGMAFRNNLMYLLRYIHTPPYPEARSIHRLDRNTSGIILIAKSAEIQREMSIQFKTKKIKKRYIAFVHNVPTFSENYTISAPISKDIASTEGTKFCVVPEKGKEAITLVSKWRSIGRLFSEFYLEPITGRTHQLRVHCAAIGHPIVGDKVYGSTESFYYKATLLNKSEKIFSRHALHCYELIFFHPWYKKEITLTVPLPQEMVLLREELEKK
ncbi:MAG: RluA family pseudouridine synthase [Chitinispirillaceae bacterium]|nr:RluA family pseudouridine synthase [Chitinispirillaceae bacterium]